VNAQERQKNFVKHKYKYERLALKKIRGSCRNNQNCCHGKKHLQVFFFFFGVVKVIIIIIIIIIINHIENQHNHILHAIQTKDMDMSSVHPCREKEKEEKYHKA